MKTVYKVHPKHGKKTSLITTVSSGEAVNLLGKEVTKVVPETEDEASYEVKIRAATQADLKEVHLRGERDTRGHLIVIAVTEPSGSGSGTSKK